MELTNIMKNHLISYVMKSYIIILSLLIINLFIGCKNQPENVENKRKSVNNFELHSKEKKQFELYEKIKLKKISELSGEEKQRTIDDWVNLLKNELAFIDAEKSLKEYTSEIVNRDRDKNLNEVEKMKNRKNDRITHYKSMGVQNPEKAVSSESNLIKNYLIILQKYPELKNIDRPTLRDILARAAGSTDYSEIRTRKK